MKYTDLGKLIKKNEGIHWTRMKELFYSMKGITDKLILYPLLVITITFFHWIFMIVHTLFESWVYLSDPQKFEENIKEGLRN